MNPLHHPAFHRFEANVAKRLSAGVVEYGDASMRKPSVALIEEVQQELEDVTGWSAILWLRLENIKAMAEAVDPAPQEDCA
jgi:hypothetical protein